MPNEFHATYEHGVLKLDAPLSLPEQARVTGLVLGVETPNGVDAAAAKLSDADFEQLLDDFSVHGCQSLPADFSRDDIYSDHD